MMKQESGDVTGGTPPKRKRKTDTPSSTALKSDSSDPVTEQHNQSSAARILQELPRYNWLEQKILQRNFYNQSPGSAISNSSSSQTSRGSTTKSPSPLSPSVSSPQIKTSRNSQESLSLISDGSSSKHHGERDGISTSSSSPHSGCNSSQTEANSFLSMPELIPVNTCDGEDMAAVTDSTLPENEDTPTPLKLEVTVIETGQEDRGFDYNIPSPDDCNDERGLTIDLGEAEGQEEEDNVHDPQENVEVKMETDEADDNTMDEGSIDPAPLALTTGSKSQEQQQQPFNLQQSLVGTSGNILTATTTEAANNSTTTAETSSASSYSSISTTSSVTSPSETVDLAPKSNDIIKSEDTTLTLSHTLVTSQHESITSSASGGDNLAMTTSVAVSASFSPLATFCSTVNSISSKHRSDCSVLQSTSTKTTTTVTGSIAASSLPATTSTSSTQLSLGPSEGAAPLDLCLKKSEALASSSCRTKGYPPVQMVLPQVQQKLSAVTSQPGTGIQSQPASESKSVAKSTSQSLQLADGTDAVKSEIVDDGLLSSKAHNLSQITSLGPEYKAERCFPLHTDTLDLCMKTASVNKSPSTDSFVDSSTHQRLHGDEISESTKTDDSITIGLALSGQLDPETDNARVGRLISSDGDPPEDALSQASSDSVASNLRSDIMVLSTSYQASKSMTDAELDQEFQKHLIEFKALEKLAERKAQEQMQVAIMRKRKAEMLRIMEIKKAKREIERVTQNNSISKDSDRLKTTVSTSLISSLPSLTTVTATTGVKTTAAITTTPLPPVPPVPAKTLTISTTTSGHVVSTLLFPNPVIKMSPPASVPSEQGQFSKTAKPNFNKEQTEAELTKTSDSLSESSGHIKTEVKDPECSEIMSESTTDNFQAMPKLEGKTEPQNIETSEPAAIDFLNLTVDAKTSDSENKLNPAPKTEEAVRDNNDRELNSNSVPHKAESERISGSPKSDTKASLAPVPAHQTAPESLPLDMTVPTSVSTTFVQGPYYKRNVAILEPPSTGGKEVPRDEPPQRAHNQRPFQTAGNLIVPLGSLFPASEASPVISHGPEKISIQSSAAVIGMRSNPSMRPMPSLRHISPRHTGSPKGAHPGSDPVSKASKVAATNAGSMILVQRKSLDESDLRDLSRNASRAVFDSGPKSADMISKANPGFHTVSPMSERQFFPRPGGLHIEPLSLQQQRPSLHQHPIFSSTERSMHSSDVEDDKSAFQARVRPQNIIDLTRDGRPKSLEKTPQNVSSHSHSMTGMHLQVSPIGRAVSVEEPSRVDPMQRRGQAFGACVPKQAHHSVRTPPPCFPDYVQGHDKSSVVPVGFEKDRSRLDVYSQSRHRQSEREPPRSVAVKDAILFKDHVRPSVSSVMQHRQRYLNSNPTSLVESNPTLSTQTAFSGSYVKPNDDISTRFSAGASQIGPSNGWREEQPGLVADFSSASLSGKWRGTSPVRPSPIFTETERESRLLNDELEKQRARGDIHSAFHPHSDIMYKQQQQQQKMQQMDLIHGYPSHQAHGVTTTHPLPMPHSNVRPNPSPLHQQSIMGPSFQQHPNQPGSQALHDSFVRHRLQQSHMQKPPRPHPAMDIPSSQRRAYGGVDTGPLVSGASQARPSYPLNQTLPDQNVARSHEAFVMQTIQQQQQQQYQFQQMQQGRNTHKPMALPTSASPNQRVAMAQPPHVSQSLAPPQLMFGECSRPPNYPNVSPNSSQVSAMMASQSRNVRHSRPSETDQIVMMHQRQQAERSLYEQRPRAAGPPQALPGVPPSLGGIPGAPRPSGPYGPLGLAPGHSGNVTNSLCRVCGKVAVFLCSSCRQVWYCNQQCQTKHWSVHAVECKPVH